MSPAETAALLPSTCLACRSTVWCWQGASLEGAGPVLFDLIEEDHDRFLMVHCCAPDDDEDQWDSDEEGLG